MSGFGGSETCDTRPESCTYSPVYSNATNFAPSIHTTTGNSKISFAVTANLEQTQYATPDVNNDLTDAKAYALETRIGFGNSATACDYPATAGSGTWTHDAADETCKDSWAFTLPWVDAINKCGFSDTDVDHTWTQTMMVSRKYQLPDLAEGVPITRTESVSKVIKVV